MSLTKRILDRIALPGLLAVAGLSMTDDPGICWGSVRERVSRLVAPHGATAPAHEAPSARRVVVTVHRAAHGAAPRLAVAHLTTGQRRIAVVRRAHAAAGHPGARPAQAAAPCPERAAPAALRS